jgi:Putative collagen-binding domain of a collagenase
MSTLSGPVQAQWYDPAEGTYAPVAGSPFANSGTHSFAPPGRNGDGDEDWILVLTSA